MQVLMLNLGLTHEHESTSLNYHARRIPATTYAVRISHGKRLFFYVGCKPTNLDGYRLQRTYLRLKPAPAA